MLRSLWVGVLIALPSGAGVALAILGGNTGSLVGVAISASLLPPVVNAGMLWGLALISSILPPVLVYPSTTPQPLQSVSPSLNSTTNFTTFATPTTPFSPTSTTFYPPNCPAILGNGYKPTYSCILWQESLMMGCLSLLLAILNIVCIFIMGTVVMKIKEISPLPGATRKSASFWKKDLNFYRRAYETIKGGKSADMGNMAKTLTTLIRANPKADVDEVISTVKDDQFFKDIAEEDPNMLINSLEEMRGPEERQKPHSVEFKYNDSVYHTVGGRMSRVGPSRLSSIFELADRHSPASSSPLGSKTMTTPLKGGGCVLRLRRSQSRLTTTRHTAQVMTGGKGDIGNMFGTRFTMPAAEEEEDAGDEVLMMDLDWLASHQKKTRFQKKIPPSAAILRKQ